MGALCFGAGNRGRTCTNEHKILNLARLPIPPYPHILLWAWRNFTAHTRVLEYYTIFTVVCQGIHQNILNNEPPPYDIYSLFRLFVGENSIIPPFEKVFWKGYGETFFSKKGFPVIFLTYFLIIVTAEGRMPACS